MAEFSGIRSQMYKECLKEFPSARNEDFEVMNKYLAPKDNEIVLEIGAGSGFFSEKLSEKVKKLIVSDPSKEQLEEVKKLGKKNIEVRDEGADKLTLGKEIADAIWSFGAMHHCFDKTKAFENFARVLKKNGRLVMADVWHDSKLAKHFDTQVAKFCVTGHEVAFWSDEFAESLCFLTGFEKPKIYDLKINWKFKSKEDIGTFLYKIHAMTKTNPEECLRGAEEILGIEKKGDLYCLNWPMKVMISKKK
ncbi:methyltransferase type 11 [Candidatus Pacearchaeota archaeon CG10_big_fil_rev_8_21_14_0_10_34_76]|nr:MAG: methyltransferase type 11 [Candidatus Pacearchaeota archaeon CG10_big_fil_rev_8_21_14_0_10_34_76]